MNVSLPATGPGPRTDDSLAEVVEQLTARLKAGEAVDLDACLAADPDHAAELRRRATTWRRCSRTRCSQASRRSQG